MEQMENMNVNLKEDAHTAQMLANIADEIYEDIKDLIENAESVSIKVGNNKPIDFKIDEFAKIAKSE